ncbi:MAG: helix-turn-helix transcriptional regulator [Thermoplasmata archaeon]|nr:helix-turn-helix transcriptional regulator [Thermoplasmata archaeon]
MMISEDPELEILSTLSDKDVFTLAKGLSKEELRSPFTNGAFGLDEKSINQAIRKMKATGLISSRRDGNDHVYFLNKSRFHDIIIFLQNLVE